MRILVDENIPNITVQGLRAAGHDVLDIRGTAQQGLFDDALWNLSQSERRVLVTTGKCFSEHRGETHWGFMMTRGKNTKRRPWPPKKADLEALIEEAIVDAYGESEQRTGFYTMIEEHLGVPFEAEILGVAATIEGIDMTDDEQIVAICRRGRSRQAIPILDLPLPDPLPAGAEWIEAYHHWARVV